MLTEEKLQEIKQIYEEIYKNSTKEIINIIDNELKQVCEKYHIPPENLILQSYPNNQYVIAIKISGFSIEMKYSINEETKK